MARTDFVTLLFQLPVVQAVDGDIVEHHSKRSMQVVEQFSDLSFIPCSFVAKDSSRKKRRSFKSPSLPSHDPVSTLFMTYLCTIAAYTSIRLTELE